MDATSTDSTASATDTEDATAQQLLADAMTVGDQQPDGADKLGDAGKKALDTMKAERNAAKNELKALQVKLKEFEDAGKTEAQKLAERAEAAEKAAAEAAAKLLRLEVAQDKGLTAAQAKRLVGTTREELDADADELLATFGGAATASTAQSKSAVPKPDPSQGPKNPGAPQRPRSLSEAVKSTLASAKG